MNEEARNQHIKNITDAKTMDDHTDNVLKTGYQTKELAQGIVDKMYNQRTHLTNAIQETREAKNNADQTRRMINMISRKEFLFKLLLYCVIVVLGVLLLILAYRKMT